MFSLPKTFSLGSIREHTPYFVVHLSRALGKVFKPGNNRAGEENQGIEEYSPLVKPVFR